MTSIQKILSVAHKNTGASTSEAPALAADSSDVGVPKVLPWPLLDLSKLQLRAQAARSLAGPTA